MMSGPLHFVKAIYPYGAQDQGDIGLPLTESTVVHVAEQSDDGWCRGYTKGREGWFPFSYTKTIPVEPALNATQLSNVLRSQEWAVFATPEDKIYFVNQSNQTSTWSMPQIQSTEPPGTPRSRTASPQSPTSPLVNAIKYENEKPTPAQRSASPTTKKQAQGSASATLKKQATESSQNTATLRSLPKLVTVNNLTYSEGGDKQSLFSPHQPSYVDYFWSDKSEKSGFDVILTKHINGKTVIKDVIEFMKERAAIEDAYAKSLLRLSKSTLGSQEEGTLLRAWNCIKTDLATRSNIHSTFAHQLLSDFNKQMFDYKESQKKDRKQHELVISQDRKHIQQLDNSIDKAKQSLTSKQKDMENKRLSRKLSIHDLEVLKRKSSYASEELKRSEELYNDAQRKWIDDMISACQEFEQHEEERSKFMQSMLYKYIDLHVGMHEKSAESLATVTDAVEKINPKADREAFIRLNNTGTLRPVDRR